MHENMTFVISKLNFVSNQFVLGAFPLRPKRPFSTKKCCFKNTQHIDRASWVLGVMNVLVLFAQAGSS